MKTNIHIETLSRIAALRMQGCSLPKIAQTLNQEGFKTARGGAWYPSTVQMYCQVAADRLAPGTRTTTGTEGKGKEDPAIHAARKNRVRALEEAKPRPIRTPAPQKVPSIQVNPEILNRTWATELVKRIA